MSSSSFVKIISEYFKPCKWRPDRWLRSLLLWYKQSNSMRFWNKGQECISSLCECNTTMVQNMKTQHIKRLRTREFGWRRLMLIHIPLPTLTYHLLTFDVIITLVLWWGFETHLISTLWTINRVCLFLVRWCANIKMLAWS